MNKHQVAICLLTAMMLTVHPAISGSNRTSEPVSPNASPEAKALLNVFYRISGKYTFTGQHNFPNKKDRNSQFAARYVGKTPVIFSTDFGFAKDSDKDAAHARPEIVEEIKKQHRMGSIAMITWHAVPPTADEPVTFRGQPGTGNPDSLTTVQGQLLDQQFKDLLTPGTKIYNHWCSQIDTIAFYLKQLQAARIPVLWRPYHEMNGNWFWWGGRHGQYGTAALYRQLFDRLVNFHKLNNLIWIWNVDRPAKPERRFADYFPGSRYVDILSLDVYGRDFQQSYYNSLLGLAKGKPIALAEVGNPPSPEILKKQPGWTYYVIWAGMVRNTIKKEHLELANSGRVLSLEDPVFKKIINPYRTVCGIDSMPPALSDSSKIDFSGEWVLDEERCVLDKWGLGSLPFKLNIIQKENRFSIRKTYIVEYDDNRIVDENLTLDGKSSGLEMWNMPLLASTRWSRDTLIVDAKVDTAAGSRFVPTAVCEAWSLQRNGSELSIRQVSESFFGKRTVTMVFEKQ